MSMKRMKILFLALAVLLAGASLGAYADSKETLVVATDSDTAPFTYKKGNSFKGYDIDVVKAIFKGSKYKVTFKTVPFDSITVGLDAGKYDLAANDYNYNEERAQKYLFSDPISRSNYAQILENWNAEHPDKTPITINYVEGTTGISSRLKNIENGKIDFILYDAISSSYIVKDQGMDLTVSSVKDKVEKSTEGLEYLLLPKNDKGKTLKTFIDKRIKALKKDGTLAKLSQTYFGGDYVSDIDWVL